MFEKFQKAFHFTKEEELNQALRDCLEKKKCERFCSLLMTKNSEDVKNLQIKTKLCEEQQNDLKWQLEELGLVNQKIPGKIERFKRAILAILKS